MPYGRNKKQMKLEVAIECANCENGHIREVQEDSLGLHGNCDTCGSSQNIEITI